MGSKKGHCKHMCEASSPGRGDWGGPWRRRREGRESHKIGSCGGDGGPEAISSGKMHGGVV